MASHVHCVRGIRRLRNAGPSFPWELPPLRRYEILLSDGTTRHANLRQVDSLLSGRAYPADFWFTIQEVEKAYSATDTRFGEYRTGQRIPRAET